MNYLTAIASLAIILGCLAVIIPAVRTALRVIRQPQPIHHEQDLQPKSWTRSYSMAKQYCVVCDVEVPFIPFKDPICDRCSQPVDLTSSELPTPREQAHINHQLAAVSCSKEA